MKNTTNNSEQDTTRGYALETHKQKSNGEKLVNYWEVPNTPFTVAKNGEEYFVLMGKYRFTEALKSKGEAWKEAEKMSWTRIMQVISVMITDAENEKNKKEEEIKNQLKLALAVEPTNK